MINSTNANSVVLQPFFPDCSLFPRELSILVLSIVAKTYTVAQFMRLALVSKKWKQVISSNEMFNLLFKHYFSPYLHYIKRPGSQGADDFKNWHLNLNGSHVNQKTCRSQPAGKVMWNHAKTDGYKWVVWKDKNAQGLMLSDLTQLNQPPLEIAHFDGTTLISDISVLKNQIGVLLTTGKVILYDTSMQQVRSVDEYLVGTNIDCISLTRDGFFYRSSEGLLFYQKTDHTPPVQLNTTRYSSIEQIKWKNHKIPLVTSEDGYYLAISSQMDEREVRHYWELGHLDSPSIALLPFTTQIFCKIDMTKGHLAVFNIMDGKLFFYSLALTQATMWVQWVPIHRQKQLTKAFAQETFIKIWKNHVVITEGTSRIFRTEFRKDRSAVLTGYDLFEKGSHATFGEPFVNPDGLNFVTRQSPVIARDGFKNAEVLSVSFSPFESNLTRSPLPTTSSLDPRRSNRIAGQKRGRQEYDREQKSKK